MRGETIEENLRNQRTSSQLRPFALPFKDCESESELTRIRIFPPVHLRPFDRLTNRSRFRSKQSNRKLLVASRLKLLSED